MQLNSKHVKKNPLIFVSIIMAVVGWFVMFIGACVIGRAGLLWWIVIYELLLVGSILFSIFRQVFHHYQTTFLIFLGVSISLLTTTINGLLSYSTGGSQASGAGAVILIVMQFFWVILFSCAEESVVYQFIYSDFIVPPVSQHASHIESKAHLSSPEAVQNMASVPSIHQSIPVTPQHEQQQQQQQQQPMPLTATALHPYTANPEDPNELSFAKDEVLEIINKSGNWWQAKKSDGTIGIVPSNYVSLSKSYSV